MIYQQKNCNLRAPFPYFGGKSTVASQVWQALGQPKHYIEPFFGSGAVLLARTGYIANKHMETVNDADGFIANVWRALQSAPDEVAKYCDWPVNHADLSARKKFLILNQNTLLQDLINDPQYFNPILAGYWIWAASCWIGSGLTRIGQIPPSIGQVPHVSHDGMGVHAKSQRPHVVGHRGMGVQEPYNSNIYHHFRLLSERLRYVRVVCGDWKQVCGGGWQDIKGNCGIFFDPPYGTAAGRDSRLYHVDSMTVADEVRIWCLERGSKKTYRIVLAGYFEEHKELLDYGWNHMKWKAQGGYSDQKNNDNRKKECLFYSPHCMKTNLFDV